MENVENVTRCDCGILRQRSSLSSLSLKSSDQLESSRVESNQAARGREMEGLWKRPRRCGFSASHSITQSPSYQDLPRFTKYVYPSTFE